MQVAQLVLNGLMSGSVLALPAIGLTLIFAVLRFTNFALASLMTIGAYAGLVANVSFGMPLYVALPAAFVIVGLVGWLSDEFVLKPFRASGFITTAIGSIALTIALENGGMVVVLDITVDPLVGFKPILSVFAAAVVGGLGSIPGAIVGALVVGVGEELSLLVLSPAYRTAIGFLAIFLVLTLRPRGIL